MRYNTWVAWQEIGILIGMNAIIIIHKGNKNEIPHCKNVLSQVF